MNEDLRSKQWVCRDEDVKAGWKGKISIKSDPVQDLGSCWQQSYRLSYTVNKQVNKRVRKKRCACFTCAVFSFSVCSVSGGLLESCLNQASVSGGAHSLFSSLFPEIQTYLSAPANKTLMSSLLSYLIQSFDHGSLFRDFFGCHIAQPKAFQGI